MKRVLTALVFLPVFVWIVGLPAWVYFLFLAAALLLAVREIGALARGRGLRFPSGLAGAASLAILYAFLDPRVEPIGAIGIVLAVLPILLLLAGGPLDRAVASVGITILAVIVLGILIGIQMRIRVVGETVGQQLVFFFFLVVWAGDTAAYYVGRLLGRHPLWVRVSPNKTIEGSIGGLLVGMAAGAAGAVWFLHGVGPGQGALLGLLLNLFGQGGDLLESSLKRVSGVKDSAALLPGHGGLLDRLDSLALAGPVFYLFCLLRYGTG